MIPWVKHTQSALLQDFKYVPSLFGSIFFNIPFADEGHLKNMQLEYVIFRGIMENFLQSFNRIFWPIHKIFNCVPTFIHKS